MAFMYANWHKHSPEQQLAIREQAAVTFEKMDARN